MRIRIQAAPVVSANDKRDLQAALAALPGKAAPTFAEIRAAMSTQATRDRFTDGWMHQTALELGLDVEP
jgi:hypothetical protein